jgi:hypothetical protein
LSHLLRESQQIEGKEHCQKRRLRREKILHAKAVRVQFRFDLLNALFHHGPFVVIPPKVQGIARAVGDKNPKRVSWDVNGLGAV